MRRSSVTALVTVAVMLPLGAGFATAKQPRAEQKVGNFSLAPFETLRFQFPGKAMTVSGVGANGGRIVAISPDYEMAARRIDLRFEKSSVNSPYKAVRGDATGGVRVVVRQPGLKRETVLTCERAQYTATLAARDRGKIVLLGGVRSETKDPGFAEPLVAVAQTGTIQYIPDDTPEGKLDISLEGGPQGGSIRGTYIEPAPKPTGP